MTNEISEYPACAAAAIALKGRGGFQETRDGAQAGRADVRGRRGGRPGRAADARVPGPLPGTGPVERVVRLDRAPVPGAAQGGPAVLAGGGDAQVRDAAEVVRAE